MSTPKQIFLAFSLGLLVSCTSNGDMLLKEAENQLLNSNYREAVSLFLQVADRYPNSPYAEKALLRSGETFFLNLSEPEKAIKYFSKVISVYPSGKEARVASEYIASIYENTLKEYDNAVIQYQRLIDSADDPGKSDNYQFAIGRSYYRKGDYSQAIIEYKTLKNRYPDSELIAEADYQIANCYFVLSDCQRASKAYRKLLKKYPDNEWRHDILLSMGVCMEEKEHYSDALVIYRDLADEFPNKALIQAKINAIEERLEEKNR